MKENLNKIGIIGLGLIGSSMALVLRDYLKNSIIYGYDINEKNSKDAKKLNIVDKLSKLKTIQKCDLIILAIPVDEIIKTIKEIKKLKKNTTIIDLGSTKESIIKNIPKTIRKNYIASHPMAGKEKFGPKEANKDIFTSKTMIICDIKNTGSYQKKLAKELFNFMKMKIIYMKAKEHDKHASFISHLPHLISFCLTNTVLKQENKKNILSLASGGFRDMSRLAKSSNKMWEDIFRQNKDNVLNSLDSFNKEIEEFKKALIDNNWEEIKEKMRKCKELENILGDYTWN